MTFDRQFSLSALGNVVITGRAFDGVHQTTRGQEYAAVRADFGERDRTSAVTTRSRRAGRVPVLRGGAGHPPPGAAAGSRHAARVA
jgi:hypothetical protein